MTKENLIKRSIRFGIKEFFNRRYNAISIESLGIHKIDINEIGILTEVEISLERPGLLIGTYGSTLNALLTFLRERTQKFITINIKEFNPFFEL